MHEEHLHVRSLGQRRGLGNLASCPHIPVVRTDDDKVFASEPTTPDEAPGIIEATLRYRSIALAVTLAGLVLAAFFTLAQPDDATAVGRLVLTDPRGNTIFHDGNSFQVDLTRFAAERSDFASSSAVISRARSLAPAAGKTDQDVRDACDIAAEDTGNVLVLTCTYSTEKAATATVDALATAYRELTESQTAAKADAAIEALDTQRAALEKIIDDNRDSATSDPYTNALAQSAGDRLTQIELRTSDIRTTQALYADGTESYDAARVPPASGLLTKLIRNSLVGAVVGFMLAVLIAWFRADRSPIALVATDASNALGLPLLGEIDFELVAGDGIDLVKVPEPPFQLVASNLGSVLNGGTVLFAPIHATDGYADVVVKAALMAARAGKRVLLIDGDDANRSVSSLFGLSTGPGLTEFVSGQAGDDEVTARIAFDTGPGMDQSSLYLMGPGSPAGAMSALFRSSRTSEALRELEGMYDLILVGGPPWLESAGSTALGQVVDGVVVVVERGTSKEAMESTRRQLAFLVSDTLGFVFIHDD